MLKPSGSSASSMRCASRRAARVGRARGPRRRSPSGRRSARAARPARGPRVAGLMSMNATVCSSESTICAGTSPATMPQNRQSLAGSSRRRQPIRSSRAAPARSRPSRVATSPANRAASISLEQRARAPGPGSIPSSARQLVAADRRARAGRRGATSSASATISRASSRWASIASATRRARPRASRAGRRRVSRVTSTAYRLGAPAGTRRPSRRRQRPLRGRGSRAAGGGASAPRGSREAARSCAAARRARATIAAPSVSWPMNSDAALGGHLARRRLADVVEQRAEAHRLPRGSSSSASGSASSAATSSARSAPTHGAEVALDLEPALAAPRACGPDVEVVVGVLLDAAQRLELGQHGRGRAELVEQLEPAQRVAAGDDQPRSSANWRSPAGSARALSRLPAPASSVAGSSSKPSSRAEPGRAQHAERVVREAPRRRPRAAAGLERRARRRAGRAARPPVAQRQRDRVHREVAQRRGRPRSSSPRSAVDVDVPARGPARRTRQVPKSLRERERVAAGGARRSRARAPPRRPSTTRSTSTTARPSSASRTAPPTTQASSRPPSASRAAPTAGDACERFGDRGAHRRRSRAAPAREMPQVIS